MSLPLSLSLSLPPSLSLSNTFAAKCCIPSDRDGDLAVGSILSECVSEVHLLRIGIGRGRDGMGRY